MSEIGHNRPPDMADIAQETTSAVNEWLKEHPVISNEEEAREAKVFIDRAKLGIKDLEAERDQKVRPLNQQVKEINDHYRPARDALQKILGEIDHRLASFLLEEERKRIEVAEAARRAAEEAERLAREAERLERQSVDDARLGGLDVDIAGATREADQAFAEYEKASRFAARAERETKVKVGGGFSRAVSLKTKEVLILVDANAAIAEMGVTDDIREAILKSARAYRKITEELPDGVAIQTERKI